MSWSSSGARNDDKPVLPGLIDVEKLESTVTTETTSGLEGQFAGSKRPQSRGDSRGVRGVSRMPVNTGAEADFGRNPEKSTDTGEREDAAS